MRWTRVSNVAWTAMLLTAALAGRAAAQSNDETFPSLQWNFSTPGARANAMGRAFIGMADDATAAVTNPAGLLNLTRPQAYFEFKNTDVRVRRLAGADSLFTLNQTTFSKNVAFPSFMSLSVPVGNRLAFGFTIHEFLNYQEDFTLDARQTPTTTSVFFLFPVTGSSRFTGTAFAGSIAYQVADKIRVGVTIAENHFTGDASAKRFGFSQTTANTFLATPTTILNNESTVTGTSNALSATVGVLITPNDKLSIGVQFAQGPKFTVQEDDQSNPGFTANPPTNLTLVEGAGFPLTVHVNVPTRIGVGLAYRPESRLLVAADIVRIGYSSLAKDFAIVFPGPGIAASDFSIKDVIETHVGAEYLLLTKPGRSVFVRAGVYTNPNHTTRFNGQNETEDAVYNLLPRKTDVFGTIGAGFVIGKRMQIDAAYVTSRELVASVGARF